MSTANSELAVPGVVFACACKHTQLCVARQEGGKVIGRCFDLLTK